MACVSLPAFPLQLLISAHPDWKDLPAVVVDRDKPQGIIQWVNRHSLRKRILPGMRYAKARSLCPDLRAGVVSVRMIDDSIRQLTGYLRFYTPEIEPSRTEPGTFWLNASGLSLLYPSLEKWAALIGEDLSKDGYYWSIAVGFTRYGTYAVARTRKGIHVFDTAEAERTTARSAPIVRLGFDPDLRDALAQLGVHTLGNFIDLPVSGVRKRFGDHAHELHRLARNELFTPIESIPPRVCYAETIDFDHPECHTPRLAVRIEEGLNSLVASLERCGRLIAAVHLVLTLDNGEKRSESLRPAAPTGDTIQIRKLIELRLDRVSIASGVVGIRIEADAVLGRQKQMELFARTPRRDLQAADRAFAQLRAEFGDRAVMRARLREGHLPEARFEWEPMTSQVAPVAKNVAQRSLVRRIFARALHGRFRIEVPPASSLAASPVAFRNGNDNHAIGPFIVTGGWWSRTIHREYYFVRNAQGQWLWLYYDRRRKRTFIQGTIE